MPANGRRREDPRRAGRQRFVARYESWILYSLAGITYVAAGIAFKGLLNWIIGPLWLLAWAWGVPTLWRRLRELPAVAARAAGPGGSGDPVPDARPGGAER